MRSMTKTILISLICLGLLSCLLAPQPSTPTPSSTQTPIPSSPTPAPTATPIPPIIVADDDVDCYGGPGEDYVLVASFQSGAQFELVGKDATGQYWIVIDPESGKGCWVESSHASSEGETGDLPELIPPPTVAARPNAPLNLRIRYICVKNKGQFQITMYLEWEDRSNSETGYEIYKFGTLLEIIEADRTSYADSFGTGVGVPQSGSVSYMILAFNEHGKSARAEGKITYHCK